jgi:hypothetical protein
MYGVTTDVPAPVDKTGEDLGHVGDCLAKADASKVQSEAQQIDRRSVGIRWPSRIRLSPALVEGRDSGE